MVITKQSLCLDVMRYIRRSSSGRTMTRGGKIWHHQDSSAILTWLKMTSLTASNQRSPMTTWWRRKSMTILSPSILSITSTNQWLGMTSIHRWCHIAECILRTDEFTIRLAVKPIFMKKRLILRNPSIYRLSATSKMYEKKTPKTEINPLHPCFLWGKCLPIISWYQWLEELEWLEELDNTCLPKSADGFGCHRHFCKRCHLFFRGVPKK